MAKAEIIIPIYDSPSWAASCLESVLRYTGLGWDLVYKLTVINNGSSERMSKYLRKIKEENKYINLIELPENIGSYAAWNLGIKKSDAEYICLLHSDCIVTWNWLNYLVGFFEEFKSDYHKLGAVCPFTNYSDDDEYVHDMDRMHLYTTMKKNSKEIITKQEIQDLLKMYYNDGLDDFSKKNHQDNEDKYYFGINFPTFCCLIKRQTFEDFGYFDESFFPHSHAEMMIKHYFELNELRIACCFDTYIHHHGNVTSDGLHFNLSQIGENNTQLYRSKLRDLRERELSLSLDYA